MNQQEMLKWAGAAAGIGAAMAAASFMLRRRSSINFRGRVVILSGGSRGLGLLIAHRFAAEGAKLVLLARDEDELREAAAQLYQCGAAEVLPIVTDIRQRDEVDAAVNHTFEQFGRVDVLVNNAGVIQVGPMEHMDLDDYDESLQVHLYGPLYLTLAVLPHMKRRGEGRIVNISSIGGRFAVPHLLPYCASKFALTGLSDGLRIELRRYGIYVTTICPGLMRTGSPPQAKFKGRMNQEYAWFATGSALPGLTISAQRAARMIVEACRRGDARATLGMAAKLGSFADEVAPELVTALSDLVNRYILPPPRANASKREQTGWQSRGAAPRWAEWMIDRSGAAANEGFRH